MTIDSLPWYKKYWKILAAAIVMIGTGLLIAFSGRTNAARKNVNKLSKTINDIDAEQTKKELELHKSKVEALDAENNALVAEQDRIRRKLSASPQYDPNKSEADNLDTLRKVTW